MVVVLLLVLLLVVVVVVVVLLLVVEVVVVVVVVVPTGRIRTLCILAAQLHGSKAFIFGVGATADDTSVGSMQLRNKRGRVSSPTPPQEGTTKAPTTRHQLGHF